MRDVYGTRGAAPEDDGVARLLPRIVSRDDEVTTHPVVVGVGVQAPAPAEVPPLRLERVAVICLDEVWTAVLGRTERLAGLKSSLRAGAGDGPDPAPHGLSTRRTPRPGPPA